MRITYGAVGLPAATMETLIQSQFLSDYYNQVMACSLGQAGVNLVQAANYLLTDLSPLIVSAAADQTILTPKHFVTLLQAVGNRTITSRVAKDIIIALALADADPIAYATEHNLLVTESATGVAELVARVLTENEAVVAEYKAGKTAALQFLLGQAMKYSRGAIDPKLITEQLLQAIG